MKCGWLFFLEIAWNWLPNLIGIIHVYYAVILSHTDQSMVVSYKADATPTYRTLGIGVGSCQLMKAGCPSWPTSMEPLR